MMLSRRLEYRLVTAVKRPYWRSFRLRLGRSRRAGAVPGPQAGV